MKYTDPDGNAFFLVTGGIGAGVGAIYGAVKSYRDTGAIDWKEVVKDAAIGGVIGMGAGAATSLILTGSATASTGTVIAGAKAAATATFGIGSAGGTSVWSLEKFDRGWEIERRLCGMGNNFPVIDKFKSGINGFAESITSIKSMDLACKTYQRAGAVFSRLTSYIDKVANYTSRTMNNLTISANSSTQRFLELAIPVGATPEQQQAIQQAIEYGSKKGVEVIVHVIE